MTLLSHKEADFVTKIAKLLLFLNLINSLYNDTSRKLKKDHQFVFVARVYLILIFRG